VSWNLATDGDGKQQHRSSFVDDLLEVLDPDTKPVYRALGAVAWPSSDGQKSGAEAPSATSPAARRARLAASSRHRPAALAGLSDELVLAELRSQESFSATALESLLDCPVKWFVERWLRGEEIERPSEPLQRGKLAHAILQHVFEQLRAPLSEQLLPQARRLLDEALEHHDRRITISPEPARNRAQIRALQANLDSYLSESAASGPGFVPSFFELAFGDEGDPYQAVTIAEPGDGGLGDDAPTRLKGRIDRIDIAGDGRRAVVVDYKSGAAAPQAKWLSDRKVQAALYLHAARTVLDLDVAGAVYQPLSGDDLRPRGAVRQDALPGFPLVKNDVLEREDFETLLGDVLKLVYGAVRAIRAGQLKPSPKSCAFGGDRCEHPMLCRYENPPR
jgi:RecB family exonuclease